MSHTSWERRRMRRSPSFFGLYLLILLSLFCAAAVRAQSTVIRAGRLVDPEAGTTKQSQIVIVESGKIKAVGADGDLAIPAGAAVIDLSRESVLTGLFDCH